VCLQRFALHLLGHGTINVVNMGVTILVRT